jgi:hypothetical protein
MFLKNPKPEEHMIPSSRFSLKFAALALGVTVLTLSLSACGKNKGKVHFGNLNDGDEVESPFTVQMVAENLVVEPAANGVVDGHGHFHILVNTPVPMSLDPIPNDAQHIHYGQGQTEAVLDLPEGEHTLILQFAKGDHRPYDPQIAQEIKIRVTHRNVPAAEKGAIGTNGPQGADGSDPDAASADSIKAKMNPGTPVVTPAIGGGSGSSMGGGM